MNACDQRKYSASTVQALQALPEQQIPLELTRDPSGGVLGCVGEGI